MDIADRPVMPFPRRLVLGFLAVFATLYIVVASVAEVLVGRAGTDTAFPKVLALQGEQVDWVVLGASHALPLEYGNVPARLKTEHGQSMAVLAEVGAGPLYNKFVFQQALQDIAPRRLLYVVDAFAFANESWNEARISDRKLLRKTPLRFSTIRNMAGLTLRYDIRPSTLADYLTGFSKLNHPDRFSQESWQGAADFDRKVRLSKHAIRARINYLYPTPSQPDQVAHYLDVLDTIFETAQEAGLEVTAVKLPMPKAFRDALPDESEFDTALRARLMEKGIRYHDLSDKLDDPSNFFDTDHLNRNGIDKLFSEYLLDILLAKASL